jgi:peroxiredoxin
VSRYAHLAASLVLCSLPAIAWAQDETQEEVDTAFARLQAKIVEVQRTPAAERQRGYNELYAHCTVFLDAYTQRATQDQLGTVGGLWFLLAKQLNVNPDAIRARLTALRALPQLPEKLLTVMRSTEARLALRPGETAPDFSATDLDGRAVNLIALRGKVVVLHFWTSADPPGAFTEGLVPMRARWGADKLAMISIGLPRRNETAEGQRRAAADVGCAWTKVFDQSSQVVQTYGVDATPFFVAIDAEGKLLALGGAAQFDAILQAIAEKLGPGVEPPGAPPGGQ